MIIRYILEEDRPGIHTPSCVNKIMSIGGIVFELHALSKQIMVLRIHMI